MSGPKFTRTIIGEIENEVGGSRMNTLFNVGDLNRDGRIDIFTSGRNGRMVWFENYADGSWQRHLVADVTHQECGGLAHDLTGNGLLDIINGSDSSADELAWWEQPRSADLPWTRHLIAKTGARQFHDEALGDVTGDGRLSLVFTNQGAEGGSQLGVIPLPEDPHVSPWPGINYIAQGQHIKDQPEEGLAIADIDGDGKNEIVFGCSWYKFNQGKWERYPYADDYITTVIAVGDIDGDGKPEIVLSEGDACIYGYPQGGKLGWFKPGADIHALWIEHRIDQNLLDPHSLQLADLCGNGRLDLIVGEIGKRATLAEEPPRLMLYENAGDGRFTRHILDQGIGTHHARLADLRGRGVLDIVSRPLHGPDKWKIFAWYNNAANPPA